MPLWRFYVGMFLLLFVAANLFIFLVALAVRLVLALLGYEIADLLSSLHAVLH